MNDTLRIESFKSITEVELDFGQVNVFIGANGSGKSNLPEALALLSAAASGKVDQSTLVWRGARASGYFQSMFEGGEPESATRLVAASKSASYEVTLEAPEIGRLLPWEYRAERLLQGKRVIADRSKVKNRQSLDPQAGFAAMKLAATDPDSPASVFLKSIAACRIYSADTPILHGWTKDPQDREPIGLGGGRLAEAVGELVDDKQLGKALHEEFHACVDWFAGFGAIRIRSSNKEVVRRELAGGPPFHPATVAAGRILAARACGPVRQPRERMGRGLSLGFDDKEMQKKGWECCPEPEKRLKVQKKQ